jgi:hypothetical protein
MIHKAICKNCKFWQRRTLYKYVYKHEIEWEDRPNKHHHRNKKPIIQESKFGDCSCDKIIYTSGGGCVEDDDVDNENQPDAFLYSDGEAYGAYCYTGEQFGCIHFCIKPDIKQEKKYKIIEDYNGQ